MQPQRAHTADTGRAGIAHRPLLPVAGGGWVARSRPPTPGPTVPSFDPDLTIEADGGLTLSRPTGADIDDIVAACQDAEIVRFTHVPSPYTEDDARYYIGMCEDGAHDGTSLGLVARNAAGRVMASCGLPRLDWADLAGEVGYWVSPWARRQGVATRATRAVCRWAFDEGGFERLRLDAAAGNPGSNGVARRVGFTLEGTLRRAAIEGATGRAGDPRMDVNVWGLLPGELT